MRAAVIREHGGPDRLVLEEHFPDPAPGADEVIVRVRATSLNYHDVFTRRGMPGIRIAMPMIMGLDVAGEIAEMGPGVTGWSAGDRVLIDPIDRARGGLMGETIHGGLAERCRAAAHQLIKIPGDVSFEDAAALPVAYGTAYRMMVTQGRIEAGEKVLILGAAGGVGTCCVFLAKIAGAQVIACASSPQKLARLAAFGADHLIDYASADFMAEVHRRFGKPTRRAYTGGVDVVINYTGGDTWVPSLRCLRRGGRLLTCGATASFDPKTDIRYIWTYELQIKGSNGWAREDIEALLRLVEQGKLRPVIDRVLPLSQAREALRLIEDREVVGKVIVAP
jgi:alcohol dehydrogenase